MRAVSLEALHVDLECARSWIGIGSPSSIELARKRGSDLLPEISVLHLQMIDY